MLQVKRPLKNAISLLVGDAGSRVLGFLITVYLARVLEPSAFGVIHIGLAVLSYLALAGSPGIQILETRNTAGSRGIDPRRVSDVLSLRAVLAIGLWIGASLFSALFIESEETRDVVILYGASLIPLALLLDWFFQGKEEFVPVGASKLLNYAAYALFVLILIHSTTDFRFTPVAFVVGNVVAAAYLLILHRRRFGPLSFEWQLTSWKLILRKSVPVGVATFLAQSAINLPPIVIGIVLTSADVGVYSAAMKLVLLLLLLDRVFNGLFLPVVSRYYTSKPIDIQQLVSITFKVIVVVSLPLTICGIIAANDAVALIFGSGYAGAGKLVQLLVGYFAITFFNSVFGCTLIGIGREREYTRILIRGSAILVVAVVTLTVFLGINGAALGVLVGEFSILVLQILETKQAVTLKLTKIILRPLLAGVVMGIAAFIVRDMNVVPVLLISLAIFAAMITLIKGMAKDEIHFLRERFV
jgi:O-antigen/teichoic acid export membrane protein